MDRFDAMSTFLAVVDTGSLSAAGRKLAAPLTTVSRKVAALERRLGVQLLVRTSRRVELTESGRQYAASARQILLTLDEAEQTAAGEYLAPRGELSVTAPTLFGELHVMPVLSAFLAEHPEIDLRLLLVDAPIDLAENHVHVAVRIGELADSALIARKIGASRSITCASPDYLRRRGEPLRPADLVDHEGVTFRGFSPFQWRYVDGEETVVAEPRGRVVLNSAAAAIRAAEAGLGVTRALDYQVAEALARGSLKAILTPFEAPALPINLVFAKQERAPLKVRAFMDWAGPKLRARLLEAGVGPGSRAAVPA